MNVLKAFGLAAALAVAGCASTGGDTDPRDPFESGNRAIYRFNEGFDEAIGKPVATAYHDALHEEIRSRIRNFFANIADLFIGVNDMLQGKFEDGVIDWARFAFNSTFGLLGLHDIASEGGLEKHNEDFGQTFGRWGAGDGPYLVIPILGSSTLRDGFGLIFDWWTDPVAHVRPGRVRNSAVVLRAVNTRADLLDASRLLEEAALDKYIFQRDAYLQRRRSLIYDGHPPREAPENEEPHSEAAPVNPAPGARVDNVYLPRTPANYQAVLATLDGTSR